MLGGFVEFLNAIVNRVKKVQNEKQGYKLEEYGLKTTYMQAVQC